MTWLAASFLKPFVQAAFVALVGWPVRSFVQRRMGDSPVKRLLLKRIY